MDMYLYYPGGIFPAAAADPVHLIHADFPHILIIHASWSPCQFIFRVSKLTYLSAYQFSAQAA